MKLTIHRQLMGLALLSFIGFCAFGLFDSPAMHTEDIALMLNVPKKTVENYLYRAKTTLARKLGPFVVEQ